MATGGLMVAKGMRLVFAGDPQAAYVTGGSLKPVHAITMHAVLILPVAAWLLSLTTLSERSQLRVVAAASAAYALLAIAVAAANVAGLL